MNIALQMRRNFDLERRRFHGNAFIVIPYLFSCHLPLTADFKLHIGHRRLRRVPCISIHLNIYYIWMIFFAYQTEIRPNQGLNEPIHVVKYKYKLAKNVEIMLSSFGSQNC